MSESEIVVLARLEATIDRILNLFPKGVSLFDVAACISIAVLALEAQENRNACPAPPAVTQFCDTAKTLLAEIIASRLSTQPPVQH